ncbi:four helix bundle protein [Candidatus Falkowbacteria bacterium]|nr:four helix bundle protein [Candidatus Falkowbacteria bacterium]
MDNQLGYRKLNVFQKADELVIGIYLTTKNFPKDELFGLISQMRRCAVSVPANIVEGYGKKTKKEQLQFCYNARGSLSELEYYIDLSFKLEYVDQRQYVQLKNSRDAVGRLLNGFINSLSK